jgi:hypothetical protein
VTSNVSWTATSDQTWLTVSPASGTTGGTVTVTASVNTNISTRSATITIAGTGVTSQTITVTQAGVTSALSVSPSTLNVNAVAGSANTFAVTSNVSWTATSDQTWLTVSPASGTTGGTVTVTATGNTNISTRSATVTIAGTGIPSQIVTVTQAGVASVLSVSPSTLNVNAAAGSSNTFTVTSNVSWTATSDQTWLTVSPVSGSNNASITLIAGANPNTSIRTATITISSTGVASKTITVTQNAKAATEVSEVSNMGNLIYPNPVKDNVNILLSDENLPATIAIYNLDGIQLLRMQNVTSLTTIDLENYLPGIYMIRIITRKGKIEKKILKL